MKAYFVTNKRGYSRFFRWLFNTDTSHVGLGFHAHCREFVVDANKPYGKHYMLSQWKKKYDIIVTMDISTPQDVEDLIYDNAINTIVNVDYDMGAYIYGAVRGFLYKFLKVPYPKKNAWSSPDKWCCTEIFEAIKPEFKSVGIDIDDLQFDAMTPEMVEIELRKRTENMPNVLWY